MLSKVLNYTYYFSCYVNICNCINPVAQEFRKISCNVNFLLKRKIRVHWLGMDMSKLAKLCVFKRGIDVSSWYKVNRLYWISIDFFLNFNHCTFFMQCQIEQPFSESETRNNFCFNLCKKALPKWNMSVLDMQVYNERASCDTW